MTLHNYASECSWLEQELIESLSASEVSVLRKFRNEVGPGNWLGWVLDNLNDICEYVSATPSRRRTLKKWRSYPNRERLILAAYQHVRRAHLLLDGILDHNLTPGASYRDMASDAGYAFLDILYLQEKKYWPFDPPDPLKRGE